ncbi:MAG: hypothetical protein GF331_19785 [Chitinivibrionales bacterium]|nr:hypothetical protein [Chitinivibrionales bacterium]
MAEHKVLFAIEDDVCFIKLVGEATYAKTAGFDAFINDLFHHREIRDVLVDLSDTTYIDSTNLGELTKISSFLRQRNCHRPTLLSTREEISSIITGLGLDRVFLLVEEVELPDVEMQEIPEVEMDDRRNAQRILDAHRTLMSVNEKTGRIFRSVVDAFEKDLEECDDSRSDCDG